MENELRHTLKYAVDRDQPQNMADLALEIFGPKNGMEFDFPPRMGTREPPRFDTTDFVLRY